MKIRLLLAEAATAHPDGTVSMLRAGINRCVNATAPIPLSAALVARVDGDLNEGGSSHTFTLRLMNEDGKDVIPRLEGQFQLPPDGGSVNVILNLQAAFPGHGRFSFYLNVDNAHHEQWPVEVTAHPPGQKPG
jgi:hypothetical protein